MEDKLKRLVYLVLKGKKIQVVEVRKELILRIPRAFD